MPFSMEIYEKKVYRTPLLDCLLLLNKFDLFRKHSVASSWLLVHGFERFYSTNLESRFVESSNDCVNLSDCQVSSSSLVISLLYRDDMIITSSVKEYLQEFEKKDLRIYILHHFLVKEYLQEFEMKDLGILRYFIRLEIAYSRMGIPNYQKKYIADMIDRAIISDSRVSHTNSMELNVKL